MPKKGKNVLAIMLGGKPPKGKRKPEAARGFEEEEDYEEDYEEEGDEYGAGFQESADAAMAAISAGDSGAFGSALKDAIVTCLEEQGIE